MKIEEKYFSLAKQFRISLFKILTKDKHLKIMNEKKM